MRQISVKDPCVSTYEEHETWVPYDPCCSLYSLPNRNMCLGTEEIPIFLSFSCFPWTLWSSSRVAGMRLRFELQRVRFRLHRLEKRRSLAVFAAGFLGESKGPLRHLWVTCSMLQHPIWYIAWAAKVENTRKTEAYLWTTKSNRARQQVEAEELLEERAQAESHLSHWGKTESFERKTEPWMLQIRAVFLHVALVMWGQTEPKVTFSVC